MANHDKKEEHSSNVCIALSKKQPDYKGHDAGSTILCICEVKLPLLSGLKKRWACIPGNKK